MASFMDVIRRWASRSCAWLVAWPWLAGGGTGGPPGPGADVGPVRAAGGLGPEARGSPGRAPPGRGPPGQGGRPLAGGVRGGPPGHGQGEPGRAPGGSEPGFLCPPGRAGAGPSGPAPQRLGLPGRPGGAGAGRCPGRQGRRQGTRCAWSAPGGGCAGASWRRRCCAMPSGRAENVLVNVVDITRHKRSQAALRDLATRDPLSGLANRRWFELQLAQHT